MISPSQSATAVTDPSGAFTILSLAPDSYTVNVSKTGYEVQSQAGVSIFADQSSALAIVLHAALKQIGAVRSLATSSLVRAGTTSDVYSVNAAGQKAAQALGGSGSLDQAYSAIASVPGVNVPSGQQGWYQSVFIRGGDYDQVAYEFDGVPVLRASDGAPIVTLSALGQQEVQVYTGGTPATSDSPGLAGYINQVIKTGTHPGYAEFNAALGTPAFYHKLSVEAGGATPNRLFSYYVGLAAANQDYRYGSQNNAANDPLYFYPLSVPSSNSKAYILDGSCGVTPVVAACTTPQYGFVPAPGNSWAQSNNNDREAVANLHFGLPHKRDGGRDDIQMLYVTGNIFTNYFSSANQLGIGTTPSLFTDANTANGGGYYTGALLQAPDNSAFKSALLPSSPTQRDPNSLIPVNQQDGGSNGYSVAKLQYQKNINPHSYLRAIGYGEYTNWFLNGPNSAFQLFGATLADYEVVGHIYGGNLSYSNALSEKNLVTVSASYSTQKLQTYNATFDTVLSSAPQLLVENTGQFGNYNSNYAALSGGHFACYNYMTGAPWSCYDPGSRGIAGTPNSPPNLAPGTVPGSPANWIMTEDGHNAQVDNVTPYFSSVAATDIIKPNDKLTINAGVRVDNFRYQLNDLTKGFPARQFWFDAYNNEHCWAAGQSDVSRFDAVAGLGPCPAGFASRTTNPFTNTTGGTTSATVLQPRIAFTYAAGPNTVLRGSYGRYARPAATSYQQYN
ncbi:MAG: TonB-dependent receptor, partial [Candidatus Eremiobacteraeota bacterium]|nr:TonB-dependent receptor [Candidatus Eremiobacteraeota bacterium]